MKGKWKRVPPRGNRPVDGGKANEENESTGYLYPVI